LLVPTLRVGTSDLDALRPARLVARRASEGKATRSTCSIACASGYQLAGTDCKVSSKKIGSDQRLTVRLENWGARRGLFGAPEVLFRAREVLFRSSKVRARSAQVRANRVFEGVVIGKSSRQNQVANKTPT
jgi:hypothetical protein